MDMNDPDSKPLLLPAAPDAIVELSPGGGLDVVSSSERFSRSFSPEARDGGRQAWDAFETVVRDVATNGRRIDAYRLGFGTGTRTQTVTMEWGGVQADTGRPRILVYLPDDGADTGMVAAPTGFRELVGRSPAMRAVYRKIAIYGASDASVVVTGETGSGKELVARALHDVSPRRKGPFVAVNCSAIASELFESELFGHDRGAFTGAARQHRGRFERAHGGTLFLDEVGDMAAGSQSKLLRVLETGEIERVGGEGPVKVDVRVVAATSVPLEEAVGKGGFRADLFHRLTVFRIHMPALREHREDVPLLVEHFLRCMAEKYERPPLRLSDEALALLEDYAWPGNVRELRNLMERLAVENPGPIVRREALQEWVRERMELARHTLGVQIGERTPTAPSFPALLPAPPGEDGDDGEDEPSSPRSGPSRRAGRSADLDRESILRAYRLAGGNLSEVARSLDVHKATLYRWLKRLDLDRDTLDRIVFPKGKEACP